MSTNILEEYQEPCHARRILIEFVAFIVVLLGHVNISGLCVSVVFIRIRFHYARSRRSVRPANYTSASKPDIDARVRLEVDIIV